MSYTSIEKFFDDVLHLDVSRGQLAKVVQKGSTALGPCYAQLQAALPEQRMLNVDETGHPECGKKLWTWGFHAPGAEGFTWFHIDPSRSSEVLKEFLGETFRGVLGCDYFSAYRKFLDETGAVMQFCWAHLVRDVKFLTTLVGSGDVPLRWEAAGGDQGSLPGLAPPRRGAQRAMETRRRAGPEGGSHGDAAGTVAERGPEHCRTLPRVRRVLLHVSEGAGRGAHQQRDGAWVPALGDRPEGDAGNARRARPPLVRADLDGAGHLRSKAAPPSSSSVNRLWPTSPTTHSPLCCPKDRERSQGKGLLTRLADMGETILPLNLPA